MGFLSRFRKPSPDDPPATEAWPLFAFGKLPVYKDFISAGLTDDASREFRDLLSNGFSRVWSSRDDCRSTEIPLHAFLLRLPESRRVAVGALWGSTDQGGLRKFPFALFTILPAGKPAASALTALDYLPVFERRAREIRRKYDAGGSLAAVYQELRGAKIEVPVRQEEQIRARLAAALARPRVGSLARALFENDATTLWPALIAGLDAAARRPNAGAAAFRLPLAEETAPLDQMKLWTVRLSKLSPSGAGPSGVLYRTGGAAPCGVILFRDARAEDILLFHPEAIPTDFVEEIPPFARSRAAEHAEPDTEPAATIPDAAQPEAPIAVTAQPVATEPAAIEPAVIEPAVIEPAVVEPAPAVFEPAAIEPAVIEAPATEPTVIEPAPAVVGPAAIEPAIIEAPATEPTVIEPAPAVVEVAVIEPAPAAIEPAATGPADAAVAQPLEPEPPVEVILPFEAAPPVETQPVQEILRLGAAAETAALEPPAVPESLAAPAPAARTADASQPPPSSPPAPLPPAEPAGWNLPLASLLEAG